MKKDVEFYSENNLIKAHLYLPDYLSEDKKYPAIVLCHGFAGIKELLLPNFAEYFSKNGYIALTFDYRGFGESEGETGKLYPDLQITDIRNAVTYLHSLPQLDTDRIGLWGTSYGGANAIVASAKDNRIKCLAVQLTFGDGGRVITGNMNDEEKEKLENTILKTWIKTVTTNKGLNLPLNRMLTDEQSKVFYEKNKDKYPQLNIKIPFLTMKETMELKPENYLNDLNCPILIVGAENDIVNPLQESQILFKKAKEPKNLYIVKDATHYEVYEGKKFNEVVKIEQAWFDKYLN